MDLFPTDWTNVRLAAPLWLLGLVLLAAHALWQRRRAAAVRRPYGVRVATTAEAARLAPPAAVRWRRLPAALRYGALALAFVALARPQGRSAARTQSAEGIDVMLVLDTSTSMNATDLFPSRFEAAQAVATDFVRGRASDRIGLVVFAGKAFTQAPLTLDYAFLQRMLALTQTGMLEDGTAIGSALATAVARLRDADAKSKVVILLTDGRNNRGEVDPETAAAVAETEGVRVYAIGVGDPAARADPFGEAAPEIDEAVLRRVAERTGGAYYLATSREALASIYDEIGRLETSRLDQKVYANVDERFAPLLALALLLLLVERLLAATWLRTYP